MPGGTYLVGDVNEWDLAVSPVNPTVLDYGEAEITAQILAREEAHSRQLVETTSALAFWTTESLLPFGGYDKGQGYEVGELGRAKPTKGGAGYYVGLPIREWQYGWQGSYRFFQQASIAQVARNAIRMMDADASYVMARVLDSLFNPVNYDHVDEIARENILFPTAPLHVKALVNADGLEIPAGPNGERFNAATHTHYAAETGFSAAGVAATIKTVREHTRNSVVEVWINQAEEVGMNALTPNFTPLMYAGIVQATTRDVVDAPNLDAGNIGDRMIGVFNGAKVWVKPQMPAGYVLAVETNSPMKPVGIRYNDRFGGRSLAPYIDDEDRPLRAKTFSRYFGCGVWNRTAAAILKVNNADTTYVAPTFPDLAA